LVLVIVILVLVILIVILLLILIIVYKKPRISEETLNECKALVKILNFNEFIVIMNDIYDGIPWVTCAKIFKKDGVFLNENHIKLLDAEFERVNCYLEYGGFPLTPSLFKCPYYYGLWKNIKNINKYD
jgi:hypothetical protein